MAVIIDCFYIFPIDIEYLLEDNQRVVNFLTAGTQEDKQRFIDLLRAKIDREWEARKDVSPARRTPRRPDIYAYVEDLGIDSSLIRPHYELISLYFSMMFFL